jgi:hypothetical protein
MDNANSNFELYLLAAYDKIEDLIYPKYLDHLSQTIKGKQGKFEIKYILSKPPPTWRGYSGSIDEVLLYDWIRENYLPPPPAIPPKISNYGGSNFTSNLTRGIQNMKNTNTQNYLNPNDYNVINNPIQEVSKHNENSNYEKQNNVPLTPKNRPTPIQIPSNNNSIDRQYNQTSPSSYSSSSSPLNNNPAVILMNERHNYMSLFAKDNSKQVKLIVCGSDQFNKSIRKNLEKLAFPINEKAVFVE